MGNVTSGTLGDFTQDFSSTDVTATIGLTSLPKPSAWLPAAIGFGALLPLHLLARRAAPRTRERDRETGGDRHSGTGRHSLPDFGIHPHDERISSFRRSASSTSKGHGPCSLW